MRRSQLIAALILLVAIGGLIAGQLGTGSEDAPGTEAGAVQPDATAPTRPIVGGEQASTAGPAPGFAPASAAERPEPDTIAEAPPVLEPKPELTGLDGWLQSDATDLASFDGQVRIVQFWTFGCHNCKATLPHLQELYAAHHDDGLEIIGVHAPEFDHEADVGNIAAAAIDLGVTWPIALDTDKVNFRSWQGSRRFWPRTYVLDRNGDVRYDHIGEGRYDELTQTVEYLLAEGR